MSRQLANGSPPTEALFVVCQPSLSNLATTFSEGLHGARALSMNDYSVPTAYGFRDVLVKGFVDEVGDHLRCR